jgi:hypothetical protein
MRFELLSRDFLLVLRRNSTQALSGFGILLLVFFLSACNPIGQTSIGSNFYPGVTLSPVNSIVVVSNAQVFSNSIVNVTVYLRDANNAPFISTVPTVSLQTSGGSSTGIFSPVTNNGDGSYSATFSGAGAGTATAIQAVVNGSVLTSIPPAVTVSSGNYSLSNSMITLSSNTVASGSSVTVTLTVKDTLGNQASSGGLNVGFSNSGGSSTGTFSAANDLNNGTYTATFTGDVSGSATAIGATIQGNAVTSSLPNVTVTQGSPANIAVLSGSGQSATAGSAVSSPLIAVVTDSDSNPTPGVTVSWLVTTGGGSVSSCSATTNGAGQAQCNFTTGITAGTNTITASVAGVATPAAFTESGSFGTAASIAVLSGNGQSGTAGSAVSSPLVALVTDSNSNPVAGASVNWTVTAGGGSVSSCSTTNGSGLSQCTLTTGPSVGTNTITASVAGVSTPATFTETTTAGAAASIAVLSGSGQSGTAGSLLSGTLIAVVKDANSNAVSGVTVAWAATAGGGALSSCATTTNISGQTQCRLTTGTIAGTNTVTASVSGISTPATFTETATAGTAASISVSSGGGQSAVAGAADSSPLVAVVKDSNSNVVSGVTVTWAVTAGGGAVSSCTTTTNGLGQVQCNLTTGTTVGTNTVTASVSGIGAPATFTQTTTVGAAASINVSSGGGQTGTAGSPLSGSLIAIVKDSNSNIISGVTVTWAVTAGGGSLSSCTTSTNGSGQVQCNFTTGTTVGTNTATATVSGVATPATFTETTTAGAATSIAVSSGGGQTGTAGAPLPGTLIAVVKDTNSNLVSGVTVTWAVTAGGGSLSSCTTSTNSSGLAQCTLTTGATSGTNTVNASVTGIATPATFTETGNAGAASSIAISNGNSQTGQISTSLAHSFQVTVEDSNGNLVSGATINWVIASGSGSLSSTSNTTSVSGISTSTLTLQSSVGTETVTATINGTSTLVTFTAYAIAYTNVRPITINYSQVGGASETNFPMLFSGTYSYLSTTANGGYVTNSSGYDIVFTTDSLCTSKVPGWEIESYSPTTGAVNFWVDIPSLSATANTTIYLCYGNSNITTFQSTAASTWDSNYTGIWHMNNSAASTTVTDSTGANNGVNGANTSTKSVTGKIGNALSYNGSSDGTDLGSAVSYVTSGVPFTVELWAYMSTVSGYPTLLELDDSGGNNWELFASNQGGYSGMDIGSSSGWVTAYTNTTTPVGSWHFWVATYNGGTRSTRSNFAIYEDAVSQSLGAPSGFGGHANHTYFGKDDQNHFNGYLDEIKFSKTARSPGWITAEFNNQNSPSTFYAVGSTL